MNQKKPLTQGKKPQSASPKKKSRDFPDEEKKQPLKKKEKRDLLAKQVEDLKRDYLYLKADFENYKKNALKEKSALIRYGVGNFISSLAEEVLDNFDRAFQSNENQSPESFRKGMSLIHSKFQTALKNAGVTALNPVGEPFDPACHEALSREVSDETPEGCIIAVIKKAYKLHDRLIRPAQVIVSKGKAV